jgi:drug/metabolite transporter (DMT)-like permease
LSLISALVGAVIISFSAIFFALSEVSPVTGAFYRSIYALPVLFILWWVRRDEDRRPASRRWLAFGSGLVLGLDMVAWHTSIEFIGVGLATLIANAQVIFVAMAAWLLQGEKPARSTMVAIPVVLFGVAMVSGVGQADAYGENPLAGSALALLAAMLYATFILGLRKSNDQKAPAAGPLMEATAGAIVTSLVVSAIGSGIDFGFTWTSHRWLLALALGSHVTGWLLIGYAMPRLPAVETATIILLQPALTIVWGAMIFDERPSPVQILGMLIVMTGVATVAVISARGYQKLVPVET